jgi:competence protein ComEA
MFQFPVEVVLVAGLPSDVLLRRIRSVGVRAIDALRQRFADSSLLAVAAAVVLLLGATATAAVFALGSDSPGGSDPSPPPVFTPAPATTTTIAMIFVHAAGAVRQPGLHRLPAGSRVADLIEVAGGVDDSIDIDRINLAAPVSDGERVYMARRGEAVPAPLQGPSETGGAAQNTGPLDLNTATQQQLEDLPGVGPATAAAILSARVSKGRFSSVEDLLDVRGIGTARLDQLRSLVTVR